MTKLMKLFVVLAAVLGLFLYSNGCTQEERDEAINRAKNAADALNGGEQIAEKHHETPLIVQKQQKAEQKRQNQEWTPENQKRYPLEFCQAQLGVLTQKSEQLEVVAHTVATQLSRVKRGMADETIQLKNIKAFLDNAKAAYRQAEATGAKTVTLGGVTMSLELAKKKMAEAYNRRNSLDGGADGRQNQVLQLENKLAQIQGEQKKLEALKQRIQLAMDNIRVKQAVEGEANISASLGELQDAINALDGTMNEPALEELVAPSPAASVEEDFKALMSE